MYYSPGWAALVSQSESTFKWCQLSISSGDRRYHGSSGQVRRPSQHRWSSVRDFIFSAERRRHLFVLSLHHHVIICCRYDPLAHPLVTGCSKCKLKKKIRPCRVDGKMFSFSPPEINPCQLRLLGSTCQELVTFRPPSDPNFGCLSCSINDLEWPHSLVLLLYLGWATEHKKEQHSLWESELCTISEVEWTTEGDSL